MRAAAPRTSGALPLLLGAATLLLVLAGGYLLLLGGTAPPARPAGGPAWSLIRDDGRRITDRDLRGRYVLLYFGYTSCADVCPITLATVSQAVDRLGAQASQVQPVFITVDPARDSAAVLHRYVRQFGPRLIGLTGSQSAVAAVLRAYRIEALLPAEQAGNYQIDHSSVLLLVAPDGRILAPLAAGQTAGQMAAGIRRYL